MKIAWKTLTVRTSALLILLLATAYPMLAVDLPEWRQDVVDTAGGKYSSLRIDKHGNAHVAYMDEAQTQLKYSFWDQHLGKWFTTVLDRSRGFCSLALDSHQRPHISYLAWGEGQLKYAFWNGSDWEKQIIRIKARDISFYTSIAVDADDKPSISYYEYWGTGDDYRLNLRSVSWNGTLWEVRTVDSDPGSGKFNSMEGDLAGTLHIAYANVKYENASLRYAHWNGKSWERAILEGANTPGYGAQSVALVLDKSGTPHVAYADPVRHLVRYAARRNGAWEMQSVDSLAQPSYPDRYGIALDEEGNPYISYYDAGPGLLKVAHRNGKKWEVEVVDQNAAGFTSSLQIAGKSIWVTYLDQSRDTLKCARRQIGPAVPMRDKTSSISR